MPIAIGLGELVFAGGEGFAEAIAAAFTVGVGLGAGVFVGVGVGEGVGVGVGSGVGEKQFESGLSGPTGSRTFSHTPLFPLP